MKSVGKKAVAAALALPELRPQVREALEIRRNGAPQAVVGKIKAMLAYQDPATGRVHHVYRHCATSTHRWTSHGPQVQNMRRIARKDLPAIIAAVRTGDIERVRPLGQPFDLIGEIARPLIRAAPGKNLFIGDLSTIEPRTLAYLTGDQQRLADFRAFDAGESPWDIYVLEYCRVFGVKPETVTEAQRGLAKLLVLAFCYQGAIDAFKKIAPPNHGFTDAEINALVNRWRAANPRIVRLWYAAYRAAVDAVRHPGQRIRCGHVAFECDEAPFLVITLPSSSQLFYPHARFIPGERRPVLVAKDNSKGGWRDANVYGGKLVENITSAVARDVLAGAMLRLEGAGYPVITHTHDEVVAEVADDFGSADEFARLMTVSPVWAPELPVAAKVAISTAYTK